MVGVGNRGSNVPDVLLKRLGAGGVGAGLTDNVLLMSDSLTVERYQIRLVIYDVQQEVIVQWL